MSNLTDEELKILAQRADSCNEGEILACQPVGSVALFLIRKSRKNAGYSPIDKYLIMRSKFDEGDPFEEDICTPYSDLNYALLMYALEVQGLLIEQLELGVARTTGEAVEELLKTEP